MTDTESSTDQTARATAMLPLVRRLARSFYRKAPNSTELDDLISAGYVGLAAALGACEGQSAEAFQGYAVLRIRGAILDHLRASDPLGRSRRKDVSRVSRLETDLAARLGRAPSSEELAGAAGITVQALDETRCVARHRYTCDMLAIDAAPTPDSEQDSPEERVALARNWERVQPILQSLEPRLREVIKARYFDELTLSEVGARLGVSDGRVSQLHQEALERVRKALARDGAGRGRDGRNGNALTARRRASAPPRARGARHAGPRTPSRVSLLPRAREAQHAGIQASSRASSPPRARGAWAVPHSCRRARSASTPMSERPAA